MAAPQVSETATHDASPTRSLSASLARVVALLELDQPIVVTMPDLARLVREAGVKTAPKVVADRLRRTGWLLPTALSGVWEFAPGAHAGPIGHGDTFITVRAATAAHPELRLAVAGTAAMWAQHFLDRAPERVAVAIAGRDHIPVELARAVAVSRFTANLPALDIGAVPVQRPATVLVHAATHPYDMSWGSAVDGLPELIAAGAVEIEAELEGRPFAVRARTAYIVHGVRPDLANTLLPPALPGHPHPRTWFGPRGKLRRHNQRFGIADTLLPFDPARLAEEPAR